MKINREGYSIIFISFCVAAILSAVSFIFTPAWLGWIATVVLLVLLSFIVAFFREPLRPRIEESDLVFSPADGTIVAIEEIEEKEYLKDKRMQISVFMSLTNVHVNWFPVGGRVEYYKYHPGKYMVAWHPKSSELNERTTTVVDTGRCKILFRQIAGFMARRIVSYASVGAEVVQNDKCGFIKFGSRVDVMLPPGSQVLVGIGEKVVGSQTPLARLK